jgi:hypothetical protein
MTQPTYEGVLIFASDIPELTSHPTGFPAVWLKIVFIGFGEAEKHGTKGLVVNYVRSVEAAQDHYRQGRLMALTFINRVDPRAVPIQSAMRASISFEDCISHMHRAIRCLQGLRNIKTPEEVRNLFPTKPDFMKGAVESRIRAIRDAIQHTYQQIFDGKMPEGLPFAMGLEGTDTPVPESDQTNQVLRTWDGVHIGPHKVKFCELVAWLEEMGECAQRLAV